MVNNNGYKLLLRFVELLYQIIRKICIKINISNEHGSTYLSLNFMSSVLSTSDCGSILVNGDGKNKGNLISVFFPSIFSIYIFYVSLFLQIILIEKFQQLR